MASDERIEQRMIELRRLSGERAQAKRRLVYLEHFRKSKLAILMKAAAFDHKTTAAQEREARAHPEYIELLEGMAEATEEFEKLDWELRISMKGADLWQTLEASKRAERRGYGA